MTMPIATHVPPSWSLTTLTASSTGPFAGLLHPAADHEVHRVFARNISTSPASSPMQKPSRAFPSPSSRARRLRRPLPPRRHRLTTGSTSRPFSTRESVAPLQPLPAASRPILSWASQPEAPRPSSPLHNSAEAELPSSVRAEERPLERSAEAVRTRRPTKR